MLGQSNTNTIASYIKIENEDITVTQNGIYQAGEDYTGLGTVTVQVNNINNQVKTVDPDVSTVVVTPNSELGYTGLSSVTINPVTSSIDNNIVSANILSGVTILDVPGSAIELKPTTLNVTPDIEPQTITPEGGYNGFSTVIVNAVDNTIDSNIKSANIVDGVTILGIHGSATVLDGITLNVTPTKDSQSYTPTTPKNAFTEVTVDGDENLVSENIVKDVTIFGVTGNYQGQIINNQDITVTKNGEYIADSGYTGLGTVTVDVSGYISNQNKTIDIDGIYSADPGYSGLGNVTVTAGSVVAANIESQLHEINSGVFEESMS